MSNPMKLALVLVALLGMGAVSFAYLSGSGMMGRPAGDEGQNGGSQWHWSQMAQMHNAMHGTNLTVEQFRSVMDDMMDGGNSTYGGGCMGGRRGGMMG